MSFQKCIDDNVASGLITKEQATKIKEDFAEASNGVDVISAYGQIFKKKARENSDFAKSLSLHISKRKVLQDQIDALPTLKEKKAFLNQKVINTAPGAKVKQENFNRILNDGFEEKGILANSREEFDNAVRSIVDGNEPTTEAARQIKKNLVQAFKYAKAEANRLGVIFGDLGDRYFPQAYDRVKVSKLSEQQFVDLFIDRLDYRGKTRAQIETSLKIAKRQIETDGLDLGKGLDGAAGVAEKRNLSREFHFKDGQGYQDVIKEIGTEGGDPRKVIEKYFFGISQDLSLADGLGPLSRDLVDTLGRKLNNGKKVDQNLLAKYNVIAGTAFNGDKDGFLYKAHSSNQLWQRASHLGGASLAALSDTTFNALVNKTNGGSFFKPLVDYGKLLTGVGKKDLLELNKKMGYYTEVFAGNLLEENRFSVGGDGEGIIKKISDATFKFSGLNYVTKIGKIIGQMNSNHILSDNFKAGKSWGELDFVLRERLEAAGLNESKWKLASENVDVRSDNGRVNYFNTAELRAKAEAGSELSQIAEDLDTFSFQMAELVTNENNIAVRSVTSGAAFDSSGQAGIGKKIAAETVFQYKNFPMSVVLNHLAPAVRRAKVGLDKAVKDGDISEGFALMSELAILSLGTTVAGTAVVQLKGLTRGENFKPLSPKLLAAGAAQGGGAGILGDFLFQDTNRHGNSLAQTLLGPSVSLADQINKTYKGATIDKLLAGKEIDYDKLSKGTAKLLKRNTPLVSSLWYTRLFTERLLFDNIDAFIDEKSFKRRIRAKKSRARKEGQDVPFWWEPSKRPEPPSFLKDE